MSIMASNARLAAARSRSVIASVRARGVICQDRPHLSLHQPQALSWPPLWTIAFHRRSVSAWSLVALELRSAVQAQAWDPQHSELDRQDVALFARWEVARRAVNRTHRAVGERLGVEPRGVERGAVVPEADRVLVDHLASPGCGGSVHACDGAAAMLPLQYHEARLRAVGGDLKAKSNDGAN